MLHLSAELFDRLGVFSNRSRIGSAEGQTRNDDFLFDSLTFNSLDGKFHRERTDLEGVLSCRSLEDVVVRL